MKKHLLFFMLACFPFLSKGQDTLRLVITGRDAKCNGSTNGSAVVTASGGIAPYTYSWPAAAATTDSVGGLAAGVYSVIVRDSAGDSATGSITIHQPAPLIAFIDSIVVPPCFRTTSAVCGCENTLWAVVSGGTPPYSYLWTPGGATSDTVLNACYVEWTLSVTDSNSCAAGDSLFVAIPGGDDSAAQAAMSVKQLNNATGIAVYPNPASTQINININQTTTGTETFAVYDILGRKVMAQHFNGSTRLVTMDISGLSEGNYLLYITGGASQKTVQFSVAR